MTERGATFLGFAAASTAPPILIFVRALPSEASVHSLWDAVVFFVVVFLTLFPTTAIFGLTIGVPALILAHRLGVVTWWFAILAGAVAGALGAALLFSRTEEVWEFACYGSAAGLIFWLVWKKLSNPAATNAASDVSSA